MSSFTVLKVETHRTINGSRPRDPDDAFGNDL